MTMTKTAVANSRIPMPQYRHKSEHTSEKADSSYALADSSYSLADNSYAPKKSRLEQMQAEYHKNLMKEKENKILMLYEKEQEKVLKRVNTRGKVREFFKESRGQDLNDPSLHRRFQEMNNESTNQNGQINNFQIESRPNINRYNNTSLPSSSRSTPHFNSFPKNAQGHDKSSPLDPIEKSGINSDEWSNGYTHIPPISQSQQLSNMPQKSFKKTQSFAKKKGAKLLDNGNDDSDKDASRVAKLPMMESTSGKLSEFQKWKLQLSQSRSSMDGLTDRTNSNNSQDMSRMLKEKEKELQAKIANEKREIDTMRRQVAAEAEARKKKEEMDRKKAAAEEKLAQKKKLEQERLKQKADEKKRKDEEAQRKKDLERDKKAKEQKEKQRQQLIGKGGQQRRAPLQSQSFNDGDEFIPPDPQVDFYANAVNDDDAFGGKVKLTKCSVCSRSFAADRLAKHQMICKKSDIAAKKRKVFDSSKMRAEGIEGMENVARPNTKGKPAKPAAKTHSPKKDWRKQHEEFIESIRYAKKVTQMEKSGMSKSELPPPPATDYSDYVQCQYCNKKFSADVAERHIPKCKNIRSNKPGKR